jgi:hypothetical protein
MVRTQISLEPEEVSWLRRQAKRRGTSLAGVIRQLIHAAEHGRGRLVSRKSAPPRQRSQIAERFCFVGCIKDAPESDAKLAKAYLYGEGEVR